MTATPIPRSLAMTAYADLDLSVIDELPPGRTPIQTLVISDARREEIIGRVSAACANGRQAYWVCTLIEESEALQCQAAEDVALELQESLQGLAVGLVHGRMSSADKEQVMAAFKAGEVQLLVATTVIEVGVDVPNASLMIIENPERLGLSQLHQLRGRVGRGSVESHCVLMYHPPLGQQARERLAVLRESSDGFVIARKDLELRGPGKCWVCARPGRCSSGWRISCGISPCSMPPGGPRTGCCQSIRKVCSRWWIAGWASIPGTRVCSICCILKNFLHWKIMVFFRQRCC